jgi:hypothetical protein
MSSTSTSTRRRALLGGGLAATLVLAGGIAVWAGPGDSATTSAAISTSVTQDAGATDATTPETTVVADTTTTVAAPTTTAPAAKASTAATAKATPPTTAKATTPTTAKPAATAAPAPAPAPAPAAKSGQRVNPTNAQVQAAITTLHQRIPLFEPNEAQLRTFADAACTQFDQGQTHAQVVETVRRAVTYIQGASLSAADADFAVRTVLQLRCPGYL